jgi:hypothetical protein
MKMLNKSVEKFPIRFTLSSFLFIYVLQYPVSQLLHPIADPTYYSLQAWVEAIAFVISSSLVFIFALKLGMSGNKTATVFQHDNVTTFQAKAAPLWLVIALASLFALWSYIMIQLKVGMTIYTDFEILPYKLTGILFYGRLFLQPLILSSIAYSCRKSYKRWLLLVILFCLGGWVSLASGSRFVGIMFSLPLLLATSGRNRLMFWLGGVSFFIIVASLSRHFYLPYIIGDDYIQIYANDEYQSSSTENIWLIPLGYVFGRTMGIGEVLMTLSYGEITESFKDAMFRLISAFFPFVATENGASIKNIYGLSDNAFGGLGLDMFSNFWVMYGGTILTYFIGLFITAWLLGKTYVAATRLFFKLGQEKVLNNFAFVILLILIFEGRISLFPAILLITWVAQQPISLRLYWTILRFIPGFQIKRKAVSNMYVHQQLEANNSILR